MAYNSATSLRRCVEPLASNQTLNVIVVDNASTDGGADTLAGLGVSVVRSSRNLGFAAGCNLGWRRGEAPFVAFVNPDAAIAPDDLLRMTAALADPDVGVVAPKILNDDGSIQHSQHRFPTLRSSWLHACFLHRVVGRSSWAHEDIVAPEAYAQDGSPDWVGGACIALRRETLEALGGFDELFFLYCEDLDLCRRVRELGLRVDYLSAVHASHTGGVSAPKSRRMEMLVRSRILYAAKYRSGRGYGSFVAAVTIGLLMRAVVDGRHRAAHLGGLRGVARGVSDARVALKGRSSDR